MEKGHRKNRKNNNSVSIIITAYKEPRTIGRAIEKIAQQSFKSYQILVVAPDKDTLDVAYSFKKIYPNLTILRDAGEGKPAALNLAVSKARGDLLILTDGDVYLDATAISRLINKFKEDSIGAVTGRPISLNNPNTLLGYWAYLLTQVAHERRNKAVSLNKRFFCSGYLFAIRKCIFPHLPKELLSEDGYISHYIYKSKHYISYDPLAKVFVNYPKNFSDWVKQKKRSAGGYTQIKDILGVEIRSFRKESFGATNFFKFIKSPKDILWLILLYISRIYLWILIFLDLKIRKKKHKEIWVRVESTK